MAKITLTNLTGGYLAPVLFNANMDAIEAAFENTLSRNGTSPNTMGADLDMNSYKILNIGEATTGTGVVNYNQVLTIAEQAVIDYISTNAAILAGFTVLFDDAITAALGTTIGYPNIPQVIKSEAYTTVLTDAGKHIYHPTTDDNARTFTIDSNANVAYPIGTVITFVNDKNTVTIAITSDTLVLAGGTTTGSRTLAVGGVATALKVTSTRWIISGTGLT